MFEVLPKRETALHVHISKENKQYLSGLCRQLNCKMGAFLDEVLTKLRTKRLMEKK